MAITVNTNMAAVNATNNLNRTTRALSKNFQSLSTGLRISKAADDAAGLGVAENLKVRAMSAEVAGRNINDGISMIAVAEGAAAEVGNILGRMRELAVQSSSETLGDSERAFIQDEFEALSSEVDRIAGVTEFNGQALTDGSLGTVSVQVGIDNTANDRVDIVLGDLSAATLAVDTTSVDMSTSADARLAIDVIDEAIGTVNSYRSDYGAVENRLNTALSSIETFAENTAAAESRIRDVDFSKETADLAKNQLLQQAGVSILAQAKNMNQQVTSLLQG
jgi:flagellin